MKKANCVLLLILVSLFINSSLIFTQMGESGARTKNDSKIFTNENDFRKFKTAKNFIYRGIGFFKKKEFGKAEVQLLKGVKSFNKFADGHFYLAKIYYQGKDFKKALGYANDALKHFKYMNALLVNARVSQGYNSLTDEAELIKEKKHRSDYHFLHGNILLRLQKVKDAEQSYGNALKAYEGNTQCLTNLLALYYQSNQMYKSVKIFKYVDVKGLKINPKLIAALLKKINSFADAYVKNNEFGKAINCIKICEKFLIEVNKDTLAAINDFIAKNESGINGKLEELKSELNGLSNDDLKKIIKLIKKGEKDLIHVVKPEFEKQILDEYKISFYDLITSY